MLHYVPDVLVALLDPSLNPVNIVVHLVEPSVVLLTHLSLSIHVLLNEELALQDLLQLHVRTPNLSANLIDLLISGKTLFFELLLNTYLQRLQVFFFGTAFYFFEELP